MKLSNSLISLALVGSALLTGCGGGDASIAPTANTTPPVVVTPPAVVTPTPPAVVIPPVVTLALNGTAASGLAIGGATVTAKCQTGSGSATTLPDGNYQLAISGGVLPCVLEVVNPANSGKLHSVAIGSGVTATANITPLTEMLTARVLGNDPAAFFAAFDATVASRAITPATVQAAQTDVTLVLAGTIDTSGISSFVSTALKPATTTNTAGGDAQDKLLDALKTKLNSAQLTQVTTALAQAVSTSTVKQMVLDRVAANQTQLTSTVNVASNTVILTWSDSFPAGTSYRIEVQNADGSYSLVETIPGVGGSGTAMQWQRAATVTGIYRVVAVLPASSIIISTPQGQSSVSVSAPPTPPTIVLDKTEPVSGDVKLSLSGTTSYQSVNWYSDLRLLGSGTGVVNALTWSTSTETNANHLIMARVQVATDSYTEIRRTVAVSNSNIAVGAGVSGTTGTINVDVSASSQFGIARVDASFDGVSIGSLTAPNACAFRIISACAYIDYRFTVNASTAGSGNHTMLITATDKAGNSKTTSVQVPISNLPGLTLNSPQDGAFVNGSLYLSGSYSTDKAGLVTVVASLGDYQFMSSTSQSFGASMSLAGLSPGAYTLTVRATDSTNAVTVIQRTVTITSSVAATYLPLFTLSTSGELLAVEGNKALYSLADKNVRLRDVLTNQEVTLTGAQTIANPTDWQISNGFVYVQGKGSDCVATSVCIYQWSSSGSKTNLSSNNPYIKIYEENPVAHSGYVIWANTAGANPGSYTLYDVAKGTYTKIAQPAGASYIGNNSFDFVVQNGVVSFYYWVQSAGAGMTSVFDVYKWSSATGASTKLTTGGVRNVYTQTDGQTAVWMQTPIGGPTVCNAVAVACTSGVTLLSVPLAGGTTTAVSSNANETFQLHDGVLIWLETTSATRTIKAAFQGVTSTLSTYISSVMYGTGGGFVVYSEFGKTYSWNAATKTSTLRLDTIPNQVLLSGSTMYFVMGTSQTVYRLVLN